MSRRALCALLYLSQFLCLVLSQRCGPGYEWANNPRGQDPCEVVNNIKSGCAAQVPENNPLQSPPTPQSQNACTCSGIYYVLVSACARCESSRLYNWWEWTAQCTQSFPDNLGNITLDQRLMEAIPRWVLNVVSRVVEQGNFDPTLYGLSTSPPAGQTSAPTGQTTEAPQTSVSVTPSTTLTENQQQTSTPSPTDSLTALGSSTNVSRTVDSSDSTPLESRPGEPISSPTDTSDASSSTAPKRLNLGAIIGGAVGGFLLLLLIIAAIIFFMMRRRKRARMAPSTAYLKEMGESHSRTVTPRPFSPLPARSISRSNTPSNNNISLVADHTHDSQDKLLESSESLRATQFSRQGSHLRTTSPLMGQPQY